MSEPIDFFIHVPKTAGTTMLRIIEDRYPPGSVESLYLAPPEEAAARIARIGPQTRIVAGHVDYGYSRNFPRPFRAFAMLREPVDRAISLFYFVKSEPSHPSHQEVVDGAITIEAMSREQGGMQARFIAGYSPTEPVAPDVLLAKAKENLAQIIETANRKGVRVLLTGMQAPTNMGEQFQAEFRAIFPELAAKYRIAFLPFLLEGIAGHAELNQEDGIHPTAAAKRMIAEMLYPLLQPLADDMLSR